MDKTFLSSYVFEVLAEVPGREAQPHFYYPGASTVGVRDGLVVRIQPSGGAPWLATFAFGQPSANGVITGAFTTPDPQKLCVVANGAGYFINANAPGSWEFIDIAPVTAVHQIVAKQMIVFSDYTRIIAYGIEGKKWKSARLGWDALRITDITDAVIKGETSDPTNGNRIISFEVDLFTGIHRRKWTSP